MFQISKEYIAIMLRVEEYRMDLAGKWKIQADRYYVPPNVCILPDYTA
jgi:hypothetical protein